MSLSIQKAKVDLLAQREAAASTQKAEENQIRLLKLQLQMQGRQSQPAVHNFGGVAQQAMNGFSRAPNPLHVNEQMMPANDYGNWGNGLGMQDLLNGPGPM